MVDHSKVKDLITRLRAGGNDADAQIVENLHTDFRKAIIKMLVTKEASDFYARQADLKMNWSE